MKKIFILRTQLLMLVLLGCLGLQAQPNDLCANAEPIACNGSVTVDISNATGADNPGTCTTFGNTEPGVWYSVVGTGGNIHITTCNPGTNYDTKLTVWSGACGALTCITGNDDQAGGFDAACDVIGIGVNRGSTVDFCTVAGDTYYVYLYGFAGAVGTAEMTVTCDPVGITITCPPDQTLNCTQAIPAGATTQAAFLAAGGTITSSCPGVATVSSVDVTTSDNCGIQVVRTYTVTQNGQTATCVQNLQTLDTTAPVITCPPGQTLTCFESVPNSVNTAAGFIAAGGTISDDCTPNLADFSVFSTETNNGGSNCPGDGKIVTRTYYVSDLCGNLSSCTQTFTYLESTQGPVITSVLPTCYKYCGSLAMASPGDITYTTDCAFDGTVTITGPQIIGPEDCPGTIYRFTYMVTDDCGRQSLSVTRDYIIGNDGPTIECPSYNMILECGDPNNDDYIQTHLGQVTANTSCELDYTITNNYIPIFGSPCVGTRVVTFTVTDACGRTATCTTTITILDTTAPEITSTYVPGQCDEIDCSGDIDGWFDIWKNKVLQSLSATDNCQNVFWSTIPSNPQPNLDCVNGEAVTWVTWVASDNCGNESEVSYYFKVINTQGPTFTFVPADGTIACDEDPVFGTATATDECGNVTISHEDTANNTISGTLSGDQEVPPSGSAGTGTVTGTLDILNGTIVLNVSFSGLSGNTTASHLHNAPAGANGAVFLNLGPLGFPTGVTAGGYTATATLSPAQVANTLAGNTYMNIHTEAVPSGELRAQIKVNTCEGSYTRTWTADNDCGPSSVASQTLNYQDTDGPVISGGSDTTVEYDGNGNIAELNAWLADNAGASATDDCNNVTWSNNYDPANWVDDPTCAAGVRAYIDVTFTATDDCGNANDVTFRFNATDTTPPIVPDPPQDLDAECGTDIAPVDLTAVDNSDGDITVSPTDVITPGACDNQYTITRTWDFEDNCGNMSSVSQTINVDDTTPPVAPPPLVAVNIECGMDVPPIDLTALDICDGDITVPPTEVNIPGTCPGQYTIVRTWTFVDDCGNSSSVSQTINVDDTTPPVPPQAPADVNVECGTNVPPVDLTAVDECVGDITVSPVDVNIPGNCDNQYTIERTWTFVDGCGNTSSVSQSINVNDTTPPDAPAPPADETIECTDAIIPPGSLTANDICEGLITVFPTSESQPGSCPVTTITVHTWTFVDACGNESSVSQTITYVDTTPPVITCPDNFSVQCIEDVPPCVATDATAVDICSGANLSCTQGPLVGTACGGTVTNTYTAVDACGNVSTCTQVITVDDTTPPEITDCDPTPLNLFITSANPEVKCTKSTTISFNATDNCPGSTVTFNYVIDFENPDTTDIVVTGAPNGTSELIAFPIGTNVIDYTAIDACGNMTECSDTVKVFDEVPPTLTCTSVEVFLDPGTFMVSVDVSQFADAADECCLHEIFFILPNGDLVTTLDFTCADYQTEPNGAPIPLMINLLFIDCFGNDSDCGTDLFVLPPDSNPNLCNTPPPIGTLEGSLYTEENVSVEDVNINLTGGIDALNITEADGYYAFPSLPMAENYSVTPDLNLDVLNGISTFDVVLILKHILEEIPLDSPYKMIAADINNSGTISTLDLIELRKVILLVNDAFPNNNSWRFVPADFVFPDATNPFATIFPESVSINGLEGSEVHDFVGVKVGDVNNSVQANGLLENDDRSFDGQLVLGLKDRWLNAGQTYQVAFTAENFEDILGYQFTLEIDQTAVSFIDIDPAELGGLSMSNFGFQYLNKGVITTSWANAKPVNLQKGKSLFHVMLTAKENVLLSEVLSINPQYTKPEAYNKRLELWDVALRFDDNEVVEPTFKLHQNTPNPFYQETMISFELPEASFITLTVTDASGHELKRVEGNYKKGYNSVSISNDGLSPGLLYYRIITSRDMETKKMIYQK